MPRWKNKANCRSPTVPTAEPATIPGEPGRENLRIDKRQDQNHRCLRGKAATWGATKYLRSAERTCKVRVPNSALLKTKRHAKNTLLQETHLSSRAKRGMTMRSGTRVPEGGRRETGLDSRFGLRMRQGLHFFLIDLDLAGLLHLIAHVVHKQPEELLLLALQ